VSTPRWSATLDAAQIAQVRRLVKAATAVDGVGPLNEAALLALGRQGRHLLLRGADDALLGYAQLEPGAEDAPGSAQLVVAPDVRRRGHGTALLEAARVAGAEHAWAFGDLPGARALARASGGRPERTLLVLGRSLHEPLPEVPLPGGFAVRAFRPGADDDAWLEVNARAFAHHPEQGRMSHADLTERERADWFDPAGFLVAEASPRAAGGIAGYHWTKSHGLDERGELIGEVYVLGVDPTYGGRGLGRALLIAGLDHLARSGHDRVVLYVEAAEQRVVALYTSCGFVEIGRDVMYAWT